MNEERDMALDGAENVETTTEETVDTVEEPEEKLYTQRELQEQIDRAVQKRLPRHEAKIRNEYEQRYGQLEKVLRAGTGKESVEDMTEDFRSYYESQGIHIPQEPHYSARDLSVLAQAEARDIIDAGLDEVVSETDRLASIGAENMSAREKEVFKALAEYRQETERSRELEKIGVTSDVYSSKEFRDFAEKFNPNTPITEIYEIYNRTKKPKTETKPMGSMKTNETKDSGVKEFYSYEEASKFTRKDLDANPELVKAIEKSMQKW